jgi:UDP-N-acetylglucosamine 2-epimerase
MIKIATIVGARPQFIKAATVSRAFQRLGTVEEAIVHTGQHFDANMSDVFFDELEIPRPRFHLGVHGGQHGAMTGAMLARIEEVLIAERPDRVLVYGDTNSTLAGALAAAKLHVPVAHVEAGLRSFNRRMPEEVNRVLTDHVADLLFAPTAHAVTNLRNEGIEGEAVHRVGDVMLDAARFYADRVTGETGRLRELGVESGSYLLATLHRAGLKAFGRRSVGRYSHAGHVLRAALVIRRKAHPKVGPLRGHRLDVLPAGLERLPDARKQLGAFGTPANVVWDTEHGERAACSHSRSHGSPTRRARSHAARRG